MHVSKFISVLLRAVKHCKPMMSYRHSFMLTVFGSLFLAPEAPSEKVPILRPSCFLVGESSWLEPCLRGDPPRGRLPRDDWVLVSALALFVSFAVADASCGLDLPRDEMVELTPLKTPAAFTGLSAFTGLFCILLQDQMWNIFIQH